MKNVNLIIRRTHLYLSLTLLPWFLMYGISSVVFSHTKYFDEMHGGWQPKWSVRFDKEYHVDMPVDVDLRKLAKTIIAENDLPDRAFGAHQPNSNRLNIYLYNFWDSTRVQYFHDQNRLLAEDAGFRFDHFLTGMHARGGYHQDSILHDLWALIVDLFCIAMMVWIITGIYMWWKIKAVRMWGSIAIAGGIVSFTFFLIFL